MFSLQTMLGGKDRILDLLQASTDAAVEAATAAHELAVKHPEGPTLATFTAARRRERDLANEISEELVNTFVTVLDREDIESLNSTLYKIPKKVERFAERYMLVAERLEGVDFSHRTELLLGCTQVLAKMVRELSRGLHLSPMRSLQRQLQALESEADDLLLEPYRNLYLNSTDPMRVMLAKDLFELLEQAINRCRDAGNTIYSVVLKNS